MGNDMFQELLFGGWIAHWAAAGYLLYRIYLYTRSRIPENSTKNRIYMKSRFNKHYGRTGSMVVISAISVLLTVSGCSSDTNSRTNDETSVVTIPSVAPTQEYVEPSCDKYVDMDCDGIRDKYDDDADGNYINDVVEQEAETRHAPNPNNPIDADNDGIPDDFDADPGNDGWVDLNRDPGTFGDADNDGVPNSADWDVDGDGIADSQW